MCAGKAPDSSLRSLSLSTRIMQNILMASSYILENSPIWLCLTAFEERVSVVFGVQLSCGENLQTSSAVCWRT